MFQKILIAEDHDSTHIGIKSAIDELKISNAHFVKHCDEAFLKIKRAIHDQEPFELLVTDLSFNPVQPTDKIKSGEELMNAIRKEKINISILVFSVEDKPLIIKKLLDKYDVSGYITKSRHDSRELKKAIENISKGKKYISPEIEQKIHLQRENYVLEDIDFEILQLLCNGYNQDEISDYLKEKEVVPNSKSSIEKKLKTLKEEFQAKSNIELVVILQGLGLLKN